MASKVFVGQKVVDGKDASVSVFDRGFLYGDSVYEVMRTSGGRPVELEAHLKRLARSAEGLALPLPAETAVRAAIRDTLAAAQNEESYVRVVVTRGSGEVGLDTALAGEPNLLVIVKPLTLLPAACYAEGVALQIVDVQRTSSKSVDPSVKSGNYLNNILALMEAKKAGAYECLMCNADGFVAEGSSSNVFVVREGVLVTPALATGLLAGITRQRVLALATELGVETQEGTLRPKDVLAASEVFITSSIRGIVPVRTVDGAEFPTPAPGPTTARLMTAYDTFLKSVPSL